MPSFKDLLDAHAVTSWDKQESLFRLMGGEHDWRIDLAAGLLTLSNAQGEHTLPIQWLGTADIEEKLWVWAWANDDLEVPESLTEAAKALNSFGEQNEIAELIEPELNLEATNGDLIALVACGLRNADGYYLCEMDHGAEYFLFQSDEVRALGEAGPVRCMNVFLSILPHVAVTHRLALENFLRAKGYELAGEGGHLVASSALGEIFATFDDQDRISEIRTQLHSTSNGGPVESPRPQVE